MGTRDASTFPGFCTVHDSKLFAPVESGAFDITPRNAFLLAYRALTYELHQKRKSAGAAGIVAALDGGRPFEHQAFVQQLAADYSFGSTVAEGELEGHWSLLKSEYHQDEMTGFRSIFLFFDRTLPFVSSFYVPPYEDLHDQIIQGWYDISLDYIAFSSLIRDDRSVVVLSWRSQSKLDRIANQLELIDVQLVASVVFRFALANSENVFLSPDWFEGLLAEDRESLVELFAHNVPGSPPAQIRDDGSHRLIDAVLVQSVRVG
jgi:hypothetical protein